MRFYEYIVIVFLLFVVITGIVYCVLPKDSDPKVSQVYEEAPSIWHDDVRGVTCYIFSNRNAGWDTTISCVADSQLKTAPQ